MANCYACKKTVISGLVVCKDCTVEINLLQQENELLRADVCELCKLLSAKLAGNVTGCYACRWGNNRMKGREHHAL